MAIGAMLDSGIDLDELKSELAKLNIEGYDIEARKSIKNGIAGTDFHVNTHEHENDYADHHHSRNIAQINKIIDDSTLGIDVKNLSKKIFGIVAEAEAKVHGTTVDKIHFHEVGAVDSIVDIVGFSICMDKLKPDEVMASPVNLGRGFVECEHGIIPVPAPAVLEILKGSPVYSGLANKELTTPTGAAILKAVCTQWGEIPEMEIEKTSYGIGKRDMEIPNLLRLIWGKKKTKKIL